MRTPTVPLPTMSTDLRLPSAIGRFSISGILGHGGCGIVYSGVDQEIGRLVAIKVPRPELLGSSEALSRFTLESRAVSQLEHRNVVPVFEGRTDDIIPYIVMPYIAGGTLTQWLAKRPRPSPRQAAEIVRQLAEGVAHSHQRGILHRDIKPGNILLATADTDFQFEQLPFVPRLTDFGLAKCAEYTSNVTETGSRLGTTCYMSPEQAEGRTRDITVQTDVYGLGAVLYELLAGAPPFRGNSDLETIQQIRQNDIPSLRQQRTDIPRDLEMICYHCLEKRSCDRYLSARELADDLQRFLQGEPITVRPVRFPHRVAKWCRRRPTAAALIGLSIAATFTIAGLIFSNYQSLKKYNKDILAAAATADQLRRVAEENERRAKESLYASNMNRAATAWMQGDTRELTELLELCRPQAGDTDQRGFEWRYLYRQAHRAKRILFDGSMPVYNVVYAPDKKSLLVTGKDAILRLISPETGAVLKEIPSEQKEINGVAFSPDGTELATAGDDGSIRFWNLATGRQRLNIDTPYPKTYELVYTADGKRLFACGIGTVILQFDPLTGEKLTSLEGHTQIVQSLAKSEDQTILVSVSQDNTLKLWDIAQASLKTSVSSSLVGSSFIYLSDRNILITGSKSGTVRTIEVKRNEVIDSLNLIDGVSHLSLHPKGQLLAIADLNGGIRLRRISSEGRFDLEEYPPWRAHESKIYSMIWSADGSRLFTAGKDGRVLSWSLEAAMRVEPRRITMDKLTPDLSKLTPRSFVTFRLSDGAVLRWDPRGRQYPTESIRRYEDDGLSVSQDGKLFAVKNRSGKLQLFAVPTPHERPLDSHLLAEYSMPNRLIFWGFTPDSQQLIVSTVTGTSTQNNLERHVQVFTTPDLSPIESLPDSTARNVLISPDSRHLVITVTNKLILWDMLERRIVWSVPQESVSLTAISPKGNLIAVGLTSRVVVIRDAKNGHILQNLTNLRQAANSLAFSPDGQTLVSPLPDKSFVFTHVSTGQQLLKIDNCCETHELQFTDQGKRLIAFDRRSRREPLNMDLDEVIVLDASDPGLDESHSAELTAAQLID